MNERLNARHNLVIGNCIPSTRNHQMVYENEMYNCTLPDYQSQLSPQMFGNLKLWRDNCAFDDCEENHNDEYQFICLRPMTFI